MDFGLKNRGLVIGGTKGLGRSIADALAEAGAALAISGRDQGRLVEAAAQFPAGRVGMPDEYRPVGVFLASDKAGYITGSMIRVDGGCIRGMV